MIEPTETETLETLDAFARRHAGDRGGGGRAIRTCSHGAPYTTPVRRLDEARRGQAARPALATLAGR